MKAEMMKEDEKYGMYDKSDNELIAEFMGYERSREVWDQDEYAYTMKLPEVFNKWVIPSEMKYDTSWDWLMPVVEKIEEELLLQVEIHTAYTNINGELNDVKYNQDSCFEAQSDTKLTVTYRAIITFIKWYNSQQHERK